MARTIVYRVKTPAGAWQRAVIDDTALPQNITGLVAGETYQVDTGKGTLVDVTPTNSFTLETFTGTPVLTGPGAYSLTITAPAYLAAYNPGGGAGIYTWDTTELASGPKVLYPGTINKATYDDGDTISIVNPAFGVGSGTVDIFYRVYSDAPSANTEVFDGAALAFNTTGREGEELRVAAYMVDQNGEGTEANILTFTVNPPAAIARTALTNVINSTSADQTTFTSAGITPQSGSNRVAILIFCFDFGSGTFSSLSATWGASNFTDIGQAWTGATGRLVLKAFILKEANIPTGSQVITVTANSNIMDQGTAYLLEYTNVAQGTSTGTPVTDSSSSSQSTLPLTRNISSATSLYLAAGGFRSSGTLTYDPSGSRIVLNGGPSTLNLQIGEELVGATGNRTHTMSTTASATRVGIAFELLKA
jgi:hypothetical protein